MKMFLTLSQEMAELLTSQGMAILMGLLFDFFKSIKPKKISKASADFFDLFFMLLLCIFFCILWQKFLAGMVRWHTVLGFAITLILYFLTIHKPIFTAYCIMLKKISCFFGIIFKILLTVWGFLGKIILCVSLFYKKLYTVDCEGKKYEKKECRF